MSLVAVVPEAAGGRPLGGAGFAKDLVGSAPKLMKAARALTRHPEDARDLVQETLARAWRFRDRFQEGTNLSAWLGCLLRRQHYAALRRRKVEIRHLSRIVRGADHIAPSQEAWMALHDADAALSAMAPHAAKAVLMVGVQGLTYEDAARRLGIPVGTVKSSVSRVRQQLADLAP